MHRVGTRLFAAIAFSIIGSTAAVASAVVIPQTFNGFMCQPLISTTLAVRTSLYVVNPNQNATIFECPVGARSSVPHGMSYASVFIYNPAGKSTTCALYWNPPTGTGYTFKTSTDSFAGDRSIYLHPLTSPPTGTGESNFGIECNLPGGGLIYSYYVEEAI